MKDIATCVCMNTIHFCRWMLWIVALWFFISLWLVLLESGDHLLIHRLVNDLFLSFVWLYYTAASDSDTFWFIWYCVVLHSIDSGFMIIDNDKIKCIGTRDLSWTNFTVCWKMLWDKIISSASWFSLSVYSQSRGFHNNYYPFQQKGNLGVFFTLYCDHSLGFCF